MGRFLGTRGDSKKIRVAANKKIDGLVGGMFVELEPETADLNYLKAIRNLLTHRYCAVSQSCQQMFCG